MFKLKYSKKSKKKFIILTIFSPTSIVFVSSKPQSNEFLDCVYNRKTHFKFIVMLSQYI